MSGVLAAVLSTALGGTAIVATRFLAGAADPITIGALALCGRVGAASPARPHQGRAMAGNTRLACCHRPRLALLWPLPRSVQCRADLHHRGPRRAGPLDHAPDHDAGRRPSPDRAPDRPKEHRPRAGHGRRGDCLGGEPFRVPARTLGAAMLSCWPGPLVWRSTRSGRVP